MAHAQKPDLVFRRNGRVHLNRQGRQFSRLLTAEVCASTLVMLDTPRSEKCESTGYPLHPPVSPSLPPPCITVCHQVSNALYYGLDHAFLSDRLYTEHPLNNKSKVNIYSFHASASRTNIGLHTMAFVTSCYIIL